MSTSDRGDRPMMSDEPFEELRRVLDTRIRSDAMTAECLDDDVIAGLADGTMNAALRAAVLPHLAGCKRCRTALASVTRALAEPAVTRAIVATERGPRRLYRIAVPLAAAAVLLLLLRSPSPQDGGHRGGGIASAPVPVSPVGTVADASVLMWRSVAGADAYRVTLFDAQGRVAYETRATDTATSLPDSVVLVPGRPYLWKVEARTGFDRWITSELVEFSIGGHSP